MANILQPHHLTAEATCIAKVRDGLLIVPACGSRYIDWGKADYRPLGAVACIASATIAGSILFAIARFVAVL